LILSSVLISSLFYFSISSTRFGYPTAGDLNRYRVKASFTLALS
jgi:hypothetical protein